VKAVVKCPVCSGEFQAEPFKTWRFRFYQVKRYRCTLCGSKFNVYESEKSRFVIFRVRRRGS
jgi:transposase-like protein